MAARQGVNRYPRPGERVAPATLCQVLCDPVPDHLAAGTGIQGLNLSDLDETLWEKLDPGAIEALAELVLSRVAAGCAHKVFDQRHFPRPPRELKLDQLRLEHRTRLCLAREGIEEHPERLGDCTIGDVLKIRAFGPRCLVDLLSALETYLARHHRLDRQLTREAKQLAELPEAAQARADDPRFGPLIQEVDPRVATALDLAEQLLARIQDPPDPAYVVAQLRALRAKVQAMSRRTLEEELIEIFASTPHERNREILIGYYGWADGQSHTLAEIGQRYGMTRERTRQICAKLVYRKSPAQLLAPVLDRTLAFLSERLPCPVARLEQEMRSAGLTNVGLRLENVENAANLLGRPVPFRAVVVGQSRLAVRLRQVAVPSAVVEAAKKRVFYQGAATVDQIVALLASRFPGQLDPAMVKATLPLLDGFRWLDQPLGWFGLTTIRRHGLPKAIDKVLAVAWRIRAPDLCRALGRNRRVWKTPPSETMLVEYCRQLPGVHVAGEWIAADPPRDWQTVLIGVEAQLVRVLRQHGPILERGALEDLCVAQGMNRFSFHAFLANSPVIAQYGHSIYGIVGAEVTPAALKSAIARHREGRTPVRVLHEHGRTPDGRIWLSYRLSKAASTYAVVTVPAALKDLVSGRFDLLSPEGGHVGTLAAKDGRAWGLGAFLRQRAARRDDLVVLTLDLDKREAVIAINGRSTGVE